MKSNFILYSSVMASMVIPNIIKAEEVQKHDRPNIIYFLVDDMGFGDLSLTGQKKFSTPNIDKLASDGMLFTNHYCGSTVSGPSRACLMTGKHVGHQTVRGNQPEPQLLGDNEITLAKIMKQAGYATAVIGKWGIGHPIPLDDPQKKGFDESYGYLNMWHAHNCFPEFLYHNGVKERVEGNILSTNPDGSVRFPSLPEGAGIAREDARKQYAPFLFEQQAFRFIEKNRKNPFFLFYALNLPHANNENTSTGCEVPDYGEFKNKPWPDVEKGFAQMMRIIDNQVGAIVDELRAKGLENNTIIMFASDNGPHQEGGHIMEYFNSNSDYRGMKRDMYDGGIRTPFIVKWPGVVKPGSKSNHLSAFWDVLPSFCDIAGVKKPKDIDGISFYNTLIDKQKAQKEHKYLYFEFYEEGGKQAIVSKDWKYVKLNVRQGVNSNPVKNELYKLSEDGSEQKNVVHEYPVKVNEFEKYIKKAHAPFSLTSLFKDDGKKADMFH